MIETIRGVPGQRKLTKPRQVQWAGEDALVRLAHRVNLLRRAKHLSQRELGERSGIDQANISDIENADANPTVRTVGRLAAALGVDVSELLTQEHVLEKEMERSGVAGFIDGDTVAARYSAPQLRSAREAAHLHDDWYRQAPIARHLLRVKTRHAELAGDTDEALG